MLTFHAAWLSFLAHNQNADYHLKRPDKSRVQLLNSPFVPVVCQQAPLKLLVLMEKNEELAVEYLSNLLLPEIHESSSCATC